jgi:predicted CoA-binding protein
VKKPPEEISKFFEAKVIAVAGVSRNEGIGNGILKKFREAGYTAYPVNPNAAEINGEQCYPDVRSLPQRADAVFITTAPGKSVEIVEQCVTAGIKNVWMHRAFGQGSVSGEAVELCRENGINCVASGCPFMYLAPVDPFHRCLRWILRLQRKAG